MQAYKYKLEIKLSIQEIRKDNWDNLFRNIDNPFFDWTWLENLERSQSVARKTGWQPLYFIAREKNELYAIAPLFLKNHSYGEFIFDHNFIRLAEDLNLNYYPKLIGMSPYSPIEGYQFIYRNDSNKIELTNFLIDNIEKFAIRNNILSCNFLYVKDSWSQYLEMLGYHDWLNIRSEWEWNGENEFEDFLARFNSNQRRNIKKERKSISKQNITINTYSKENINEEIIKNMYYFYEKHCLKWGIWGSKYLTFDFFKNCIENKDKLLFFSAFQDTAENPIAMSMLIKNNENLWGRYWGSNDDINNLHFELCYYQPIEWAINNKIKRFDPGAGGNQKRRRGFYAKKTKSMHKWFNRNMDNMISEWLIKANQKTLNEIKIENNSIPFI